MKANKGNNPNHKPKQKPKQTKSQKEYQPLKKLPKPPQVYNQFTVLKTSLCMYQCNEIQHLQLFRKNS
jgi:hypothetical protein